MSPGGAQPLKTMLGPTRGSKLAKIEFFILNCSWARFWALHEASWDTLGSLLASLGALLGALGTVLGRSGALLSHSWAALGDQLVDCGRSWGKFWPSKASRGCLRSCSGQLFNPKILQILLPSNLPSPHASERPRRVTRSANNPAEIGDGVLDFA